MRLKLITLLFVISLFLFSCKQQPKVSQYNGISEEIELSLENQIVHRNIIDKHEYVKLETNDDCIIGRISQILFMDSLMVIADNESANAVYVFDMSGKFKCKIGSMGQGPGEYTTQWYVTLTPDKQQIVIEDIMQHKFLHFSSTGKLEYSEHKSFMLNSYEYLANGYKAFDVSCMKDPAMGELQENTLIVTDENNKVIYGACTDFYSDKFTAIMNGNILGSLRKFDNVVYSSPNFSNEIYEIRDTAAILKYTINIPENGMPPLNKNITTDIYGDYTQKYYSFQGDYIELEDFTCVNLRVPKRIGCPLIIYSHAKKKSYNLLLWHLSFSGEIPKNRYKDNWLVFDRNAFDLMERKEYLYEVMKDDTKELAILDKLYDGLTDESNPVIFFYHLNPDKLNEHEQ
jgi:hypothetical protein